MVETSATGVASLIHTPTWAIAFVCSILITLSILVDHALHLLTKVCIPLFSPLLEIFYHCVCSSYLVIFVLPSLSFSRHDGESLLYKLSTRSRPVRAREELQQKQILLLSWNDGRRRRREFGSFNFFPCALWLIFYVILSILITELMLFGFISLLLTVGEQPISKICIPKSVGETFLPCKTATLRSDIVEEPACEKKVRSVDVKVNSWRARFVHKACLIQIYGLVSRGRSLFCLGPASINSTSSSFCWPSFMFSLVLLPWVLGRPR